jgi:hypothetical protein
MIFDGFRGIFSVLILGFEMKTSVLKKINSNSLGDGTPRILGHSMKPLVNFMSHLISINVSCLAYLKHGHCSQQYSARHVLET